MARSVLEGTTTLSVGRRWLMVSLVGVAAVIGLGVAVMAASDRSGSATHRRSGMTLGGTLPAAPSAGQAVSVAILVTGLPESGVLDATVLEAAGDGSLRRTPSSMIVRFSPNITVAMGDRSQVKRGALLQVDGQTEPGGLVRADRLTVLTGFASMRG
jgi:hypothetical protein